MESADAARGMGEDARCGSHPDRAAKSTCLRCGSFVCADCQSPELGGHCLDCAHRLGQGRLVAQVPALGITLMVQGVLSGGVGLYFLVFGGFFAHSLTRNTASPSSPDGDLFTGVMIGTIGVEAVLHLVPGVLQVLAGLRVRVFRGRWLAFVALGAGLLTVFGCYCAPTSIGLLVWGAIVLTNADVAGRFAATAHSDT